MGKPNRRVHRSIDFDAAFAEAQSVDRRAETKQQRIERIMRMAWAMHGKHGAVTRALELYANEDQGNG